MAIVQILNGHDSESTAYVIDDYPFGYKLRCKIRYWLDTRTKGVYKDRSRLMSQTTNPRHTAEFWNRPKAGVFGKGLTLMYLNEEGHVHHIDCSYSTGMDYLKAALAAEGLTKEQKLTIEMIIKVKESRERLKPA